MTRASASVDEKSFSSHDFLWGVWALIAAFGCYFCVYLFRKPFTAAAYDTAGYADTLFKSILVTSQTMGYMLSKFAGVKIISELPASRRMPVILLLVGLAELSLILFAIIPRPYNAACMFLNGLSLGMTFGLVLGPLEGRRMTEVLNAGLCASFILAGGFSKSVGTWLLNQGISENWMPAVAGSLFLLPFGVFTLMLAVIPRPSARDVAARNSRSEMTSEDRRQFLRQYGFGLLPIIIVYLLTTILRSLRDDFAPEIWEGLGVKAAPSAYTNTELYVTMVVTLVTAAVVLIRNNRTAFLTALVTFFFGCSLIAASLMGQRMGLIGPFAFMVLTGMGLYLPYVSVHTTLMERMLALTRAKGNIGFLMYIADSIGYLGYVAIMLLHNVLSSQYGMLAVFVFAGWTTVIVSVACTLVAFVFFSRVSPSSTTPADQLPPLAA